jgi:type VI secretion system protein ImpH
LGLGNQPTRDRTWCWGAGSRPQRQVPHSYPNLDWQRFHDFLPTGEGYQPLCALVRFTLRDPLDYDIRLQLRHEEVRELRIGAHNTCRLGWTSWLGRERADGVVTLNSKLH